jgi:uncharacterized protein
VIEGIIGPAGEGAAPGAGDIRVDEEGDWTHRGVRIDRDDFIQLFLDHLVRCPDGSYVIEWKGSQCPIEVADTPFVVTRVDREEEGAAGEAVVRLTLKHLPHRERLDPRSLAVGAANILYCRVHEGRFPARFARPAYYQLAEWIVEDEETASFFLQLGASRYPIGNADTRIGGN